MNSIGRRVNEKRIETKLALYTVFEMMAYVMQVLVLYPFAILICILRPTISMSVDDENTSSFRDRILEAIDGRFQYLNGFRCCS